jgi:hypothetical protein
VKKRHPQSIHWYGCAAALVPDRPSSPIVIDTQEYASIPLYTEAMPCRIVFMSSRSGPEATMSYDIGDVAMVKVLLDRPGQDTLLELLETLGQ